MYLIGSLSRDSCHLQVVSESQLTLELRRMYCECGERHECLCRLQELVNTFCSFPENYLRVINNTDYGKYAVMNCHYSSGYHVDLVSRDTLRDYLLRNTVGNDFLNPDFITQIVEDGITDDYDCWMIDIVRKADALELGELVEFVMECGEEIVSQRLGWGVCRVVYVACGNSFGDLGVSLEKLKIT